MSNTTNNPAPFMTDLQVRRMNSWNKKAQYWHQRFEEAETKEDQDKYLDKAVHCVQKALQDVPRPTTK